MILEVRDLDASVNDREMLKGVSFDLHKGEILGIAGLMGSGAPNWSRPSLANMQKSPGGTITLEGNESQDIQQSQRDAARHQPGA